MVRTVNTAVTTAPALKRENCSRTKHDSAFSDWKVIFAFCLVFTSQLIICF
ncbi:hypothetical protein Hanom_Chr12g01067351 [Helianthus anomalus]